MKKFNLIVACDLNGVIGSKNKIPWKIPDDLQYFKEVTGTDTVIMGSNTFKSIGRKLPKRVNVVITRDEDYRKELYDNGVDSVYSSLEQALDLEAGNLWVIGGARIYDEAMKLGPSYLYVTVINSEVENGDTYFHPGKMFLENYIKIKGHRYSLESRSVWLQQNGLKYRFTKFKSV